MTYDELLAEADSAGLVTKERPLLSSDGRIFGNKIAIRENIPTSVEKSCALAEELGHHYTTVGDIVILNESWNQKQELQARMWGYNKKIGLIGIIDAYKHRCQSKADAAEYLDVPLWYLERTLDAYKKKYGMYAKIDNYIIYFDPAVGVLEIME